MTLKTLDEEIGWNDASFRFQCWFQIRYNKAECWCVYELHRISACNTLRLINCREKWTDKYLINNDAYRNVRDMRSTSMSVIVVVVRVVEIFNDCYVLKSAHRSHCVIEKPVNCLGWLYWSALTPFDMLWVEPHFSILFEIVFETICMRFSSSHCVSFAIEQILAFIIVFPDNPDIEWHGQELKQIWSHPENFAQRCSRIWCRTMNELLNVDETMRYTRY